MTSLALADSDPVELPVSALVIGIHSVDEGVDAAAAAGSLLLAPGAESVDAAFDGRLVETLGLLGATGAVGEVTKLASLGTVTAPVVVAVGLGPAGPVTPPSPETLRRAAGAAVRALAGTKTVALMLPTEETDTPSDALRGLAEGALLGAYRFAGYKSKPQPGRTAQVSTVTIMVPDAKDKAARGETKRATAVANAVAVARDWVNAAPNELRPPQFADNVARASEKAGLDVSVLDEKALRRGGYGGLIAVGSGSQAPPRLVQVSYQPRGAERHVALVGKGITFDTGGVSIKPSQAMWEMKSDMAGAAAVAGTMLAVAALHPKVAVTAWLPMAENMLSGMSYRPGDVVTMYGGKKVEVLNTDAEGRMILGDAVARACEEDPDYLLETSTLTGGQIIALGKRVSGVMGTPELCDRVRDAGGRTGEQMWPMPLPDDVRKGMESEIADLLQVHSGMERAGHMLQGGVFLGEFVTEGLPWAHIDIAGPAYHTGESYGYTVSGGTGVPVRTLLALIADIEANG